MKKQNKSKNTKKSNNKSKKKENYQKASVQVIEQKESSQNNSSKIEDLLNHPILKRRLPPIEKRQNTETNEVEEKLENENENNNFNLEDAINNNIENLNCIQNEKEEQIKDSLEIDNLIEKKKNGRNAGKKNHYR